LATGEEMSRCGRTVAATVFRVASVIFFDVPC
jgi:hypothetical protein